MSTLLRAPRGRSRRGGTRRRAYERPDDRAGASPRRPGGDGRSAWSGRREPRGRRRRQAARLRPSRVASARRPARVTSRARLSRSRLTQRRSRARVRSAAASAPPRWGRRSLQSSRRCGRSRCGRPEAGGVWRGRRRRGARRPGRSGPRWRRRHVGDDGQLRARPRPAAHQAVEHTGPGRDADGGGDRGHVPVGFVCNHGLMIDESSTVRRGSVVDVPG